MVPMSDEELAKLTDSEYRDRQKNFDDKLGLSKAEIEAKLGKIFANQSIEDANIETIEGSLIKSKTFYVDIHFFKDLQVGFYMEDVMSSEEKYKQFRRILTNEYSNRSSYLFKFPFKKSELSDNQLFYISPVTPFYQKKFPERLELATNNIEVVEDVFVQYETFKVKVRPDLFLTLNVFPLKLSEDTLLALEYAIAEHMGIKPIIISTDPSTITMSEWDKFDEIYVWQPNNFFMASDLLNRLESLVMHKKFVQSPMFANTTDYVEDKIFITEAAMAGLVVRFTYVRRADVCPVVEVMTDGEA